MLSLPGGWKRDTSCSVRKDYDIDRQTASLTAATTTMMMIVMSLYRPAIISELQAPSLTDRTNSD